MSLGPEDSSASGTVSACRWATFHSPSSRPKTWVAIALHNGDAAPRPRSGSRPGRSWSTSKAQTLRGTAASLIELTSAWSTGTRQETLLPHRPLGLVQVSCTRRFRHGVDHGRRPRWAAGAGSARQLGSIFDGMTDEVASRLVTVAGDRVLHVCEGGSPDGVPVVFHHGTPSGRLQAVLGAEAARRQGVRLVSFNRPGYGRSTDTPPGLTSVGLDTLRLADELGVEPFAVLGASGGGPYALATGLADPGRVRYRPRERATIHRAGPVDARRYLAGLSELGSRTRSSKRDVGAHHATGRRSSFWDTGSDRSIHLGRLSIVGAVPVASRAPGVVPRQASSGTRASVQGQRAEVSAPPRTPRDRTSARTRRTRSRGWLRSRCARAPAPTRRTRRVGTRRRRPDRSRW